jgi:hypothetical protein
MQRIASWARRVGFLVLLLTGLLLVVRLGLGLHANARLEEELARLRSEDAPLTLERAAPPPVAEAENAAPLIRTASEAIEEDPDPRDALMAFDADPLHVETEVVEVVAGWLEDHAEARRLLERATDLESCRFDELWADDAEEALIERIPPASLGFDAGRFLSRTADLRARAGNVDGALEAVGRLVRLGGLVQQTPLVVHGLAGTAWTWAGVACLERALAAGAPSEAALERLLARLDRSDTAPTPEVVLGTDRVLLMAMMAWAREHGGYHPLGLSGDGLAWPEWMLVRSALAVMPTPTLRLDEAYALEITRRSLALAQRTWPEAREAWDALVAEARAAPWYAVASRDLAAVHRRYICGHLADQALRDLAQLALQIERFELRHGRLPRDLDELGATPVDPFSEEAYRYARREADGGYRLWSIGPDGVDDRGETDEDARPLQQGDLVLDVGHSDAR